ncbi:MAG TPA: hypothetical protein VJS47_03850 [Rhizomicrobium sp.]|nr:hypothetical protein [Rhizomicrobium sp.]
MTIFKRLLAASALTLTAAGTATGALADSLVLNNQINLQHDWSTLNLKVDTVGGDVVTQSAAGGNLVDIMTMNNTTVNNSQFSAPQATIRATTTLDAKNVWGSVGVQNQVVCNSASVSTDPARTAVTSVQDCQGLDSFSQTGATISNVAGHAIIQNSMVGNSFEADSNALNMPINTKQTNAMATVSTVNANVVNVGGDVGASSGAFGNTARIIHYGTGQP